MEFFGYVEDTYDYRDKVYVYRGRGAIAQSVDLRQRYPTWLDPVYNQYTSGSCVANSTAAAVRFLANRIKFGADQLAVAQKVEPAPNSSSKMALDPSRLFIYYNARALTKIEKSNDFKSPSWPSQVLDRGTEIRQAMKAIDIFGICSDAAWPFVVEKCFYTRSNENPILQNAVISLNAQPNEAAYAEADGTHAVEYCRL